MFTHSARLAHIIMIMAALALCVSACTQPKAENFSAGSAASYDAPATGSLSGLAVPAMDMSSLF